MFISLAKRTVSGKYDIVLFTRKALYSFSAISSTMISFFEKLIAFIYSNGFIFFYINFCLCFIVKDSFVFYFIILKSDNSPSCNFKIIHYWPHLIGYTDIFFWTKGSFVQVVSIFFHLN